MSTSVPRYLVLGSVLALLPIAACATGNDNPPLLSDFEDDGGTQNEGGNDDPPPMGGHDDPPPMGGNKPPATEPSCTDPPDEIDPTIFPECEPEVCAVGGARCVPNSLVPADQAGDLADCIAPDSKCVPDLFIATQGYFEAETCDSIAGGEGRCLSECIPQVAEQAALLPQSTCNAGEVCVPCYDPQTGQDTGSCSLSCDTGPVEPPTTLPKCCGGDGTCVPPEAAGDQADQLGEDSCPQSPSALLCAPDVFVNDPNWSPPSCETSLVQSFFGAEYGPGACLPECLPAVDNFLLAQDGCADGFKCAPCKEPPFGGDSGACSF